jgi:hypothetical protein
MMVSMLGLAAAPAARADDDEVSGSARAAAVAPPGAGSNGAPRLVRNDDPAEPGRSAPGYRGETTELGYRWWVSKGRADLGLGLGTLAYVARPTGSLPGLGPGPDGGATVLASGSVLTLGMRYRTSPSSAVFADAASWRGAGLSGGDALVGKVGLEFKTAKSRWNLAYGGLGLTLPGDARMTLRVRHGGLALYMHSSF